MRRESIIKARIFASFWVSAKFRSQRARFDICSAYKFHFKMPRNSEDVNLGDRYAILLDESLKENQALREELKEREEQNSAKIEQLTSKVDSLCRLLEQEQTKGSGKKSNHKSAKVHVPTRCRVSSSLSFSVMLTTKEASYV